MENDDNTFSTGRYLAMSPSQHNQLDDSKKFEGAVEELLGDLGIQDGIQLKIPDILKGDGLKDLKESFIVTENDENDNSANEKGVGVGIGGNNNNNNNNHNHNNMSNFVNDNKNHLHDEHGHNNQHQLAFEKNNIWQAVNRTDITQLSSIIQQEGPDIMDIEKCDGTTPLHEASENGIEQAVCFLLQSGSDVNRKARLRNEYTALHLAAMNGYWKIIKHLLIHGAKPNARTSDGRTPLHFACERGCHQSISELLQSRKIEINAIDYEHRTPLHFCCIDGSIECVKRLLVRSAKSDMKDKSGRDALRIAVEFNHEMIAKALCRTQNMDFNKYMEFYLMSNDKSYETQKELKEKKNYDEYEHWVIMEERGYLWHDGNGKIPVFLKKEKAQDWIDEHLVRNKKVKNVSIGTKFKISQITKEKWNHFQREIPYEIYSSEEDEDPQLLQYKEDERIRNEELMMQVITRKEEQEMLRQKINEVAKETNAINKERQTKEKRLENARNRLTEVQEQCRKLEEELPKNTLIHNHQVLSGTERSEQSLKHHRHHNNNDNNNNNTGSNTISNEDRVREWLIQSITIGYDDAHQYSKALIEQGFDCPNALLMLSEDDLKSCNIKRGHIKIILNFIADNPNCFT